MYYVKGFICSILSFIILILMLIWVLVFLPQNITFINIIITIFAVPLIFYLLIRINAQQQLEYYKRNGLSYPLVEKFLNRIAPPKINKKHQQLINDVYSLKQTKISVDVKGHAKRTLELRCGFLMSESGSIIIELLEKNMDAASMKEEGESYLCMLPNKTKCYAVLLHKIENRSVQWFVKTFKPFNHEEWFRFCVSEDLALKDDTSLGSIDRIVWHEKLIEKIEKKRG
jgi:hypothetical protein